MEKAIKSVALFLWIRIRSFLLAKKFWIRAIIWVSLIISGLGTIFMIHQTFLWGFAATFTLWITLEMFVY